VQSFKKGVAGFLALSTLVIILEEPAAGRTIVVLACWSFATGFVTRNVSFVTFVFRVAGREPTLSCKAISMYKFVLLFLVLVILTVFSLAIKARSENLEVSSPAMLGSPVVVLNY
jgi:uncharacterized BrkB/YihY/UPF0761 family membrane protein